MHRSIQFLWPYAEPTLRKTFTDFWAAYPDLTAVVSFIPMLNSVFAQVLPSHISLFTVLTDFSHTAAHPWLQHPRQHIVAGTSVATSQAKSHGYLPLSIPTPSMRLTSTSGMVVHPRFYNRLSPDKIPAARKALGFAHAATALVLFGATPPTEIVVRIVNLLLARTDRHAVNVIAVCARNRLLYNRLMRRRKRFPEHPLHVTAFTDDIPRYMQLADVLIGKPGPGVVSEAFVSSLPCVLVTGAAENQVMRQERDVLDWVRQAGIGIVARTPKEAAAVTVEQMASMRQAIAALPPNRAIFEVRDLILGTLSNSPSASPFSRQRPLEEPAQGGHGSRMRSNTHIPYLPDRPPDEHGSPCPARCSRNNSMSPTTITAGTSHRIAHNSHLANSHSNCTFASAPDSLPRVTLLAPEVPRSS